MTGHPVSNYPHKRKYEASILKALESKNYNTEEAKISDRWDVNGNEPNSVSCFSLRNV
jgi:hypothetical protein